MWQKQTNEIMLSNTPPKLHQIQAKKGEHGGPSPRKVKPTNSLFQSFLPHKQDLTNQQKTLQSKRDVLRWHSQTISAGKSHPGKRILVKLILFTLQAIVCLKPVSRKKYIVVVHKFGVCEPSGIWQPAALAASCYVMYMFMLCHV